MSKFFALRMRAWMVFSKKFKNFWDLTALRMSAEMMIDLRRVATVVRWVRMLMMVWRVRSK